jgi:putative hydroxymethylpyrimidine transport system substrate-binding protein
MAVMKRHVAMLLGALAILLAASALAACGEKEEDGGSEVEGLSLTLDWIPNPDHAGIYVAEERGYFRDAGLEVSIQVPSDPAAPIKQVAAGRADLAISYEPEVVLAREQGLDVVAVGALVDRPLTSLIWLRESGIRRLGDLRGKTIATAGIPYQDAYLRTILARANLQEGDVKSVNVGTGLLTAILSGRADAILGGFRNVEGVDLARRGRAPTVLPVDRLGVPAYDELVLVARGDDLDEDAETIRLFIAALARGTEEAIGDPRGATQAVLAANPDLDRGLTAAEVDATLPVLEGKEGRPFGCMDPDRWGEFIGWMRDNGLISSLPDSSEVLSNAYLPGEIPD